MELWNFPTTQVTRSVPGYSRDKFQLFADSGSYQGGAYVHPWLGRALEVVLFASTLAGKSLLDAGKTVSTPLRQGNLPEARQKLGWFVSRDTSNLAEAEIVRGLLKR